MSTTDLTALIVAIVFTVAFLGCCWLVAGEKPKWFRCDECESFHRADGTISLDEPDDFDGVAQSRECPDCYAARLTKGLR